MNFLAFIVSKGSIYVPVSLSYGTNQLNYDTIEHAKKAVNDYVTSQKATFANGYTAYVIEKASNKVVSVATIPEPTLEWQDAK